MSSRRKSSVASTIGKEEAPRRKSSVASTIGKEETSRRRSTVTSTISEEDIKKVDKEARQMFRVFDKNGDKSLSVDELSKAIKSMGISCTYKEVQLAAKEIDKDKNGKIDYNEFRDFLIMQYKRSDWETQAREAFRIFDRDGNGSIDRKELKHAMKNLGGDVTDEDVDELMKMADENEDGKISFEEFLEIWKSKMSNEDET